MTTKYRLPKHLNKFQRELYSHLVDWKQGKVECNEVHDEKYDIFIPKEKKELLLYPPIREVLKKHTYKEHRYTHHLASSQVACINLFVPLLQYPQEAAELLQTVNPDIKEIAIEKLKNGYQLEFWDASDNKLNDHNNSIGTDSDIAIAYRDKGNNLVLWLIEHKLSVSHFTTCGGEGLGKLV